MTVEEQEEEEAPKEAVATAFLLVLGTDEQYFQGGDHMPH